MRVGRKQHILSTTLRRHKSHFLKSSVQRFFYRITTTDKDVIAKSFGYITSLSNSFNAKKALKTRATRSQRNGKDNAKIKLIWSMDACRRLTKLKERTVKQFELQSWTKLVETHWNFEDKIRVPFSTDLNAHNFYSKPPPPPPPVQCWHNSTAACPKHRYHLNK